MASTISTKELLQREREQIRAVLERRGARDIRVFGSIARGDDDESSDIDLLIELPGSSSAATELLDVLELSEELSEALGTRVDVVTPRTIRERVRASALAEAVPL